MMPSSSYRQLLRLCTQAQVWGGHWQSEIEQAMEQIQGAFAVFLGIQERYVTWETLSHEGFRLGAPDVVRNVSGVSVVHANVAVALVQDETLVSVCHCPMQIRYRSEKGAEYRVMLPRERWLSDTRQVMARIMNALVQQFARRGVE